MVRAGNERQALLDQLAAARQAGAAPEHRDHDRPEDEQVPDAGHRNAVVGRIPRLRCDVELEHRLGHAEQEPDGAGDAERREPREQGGCQRGDDVERERLPVEHRDRCGEHAEPPRDQAGEHGVDHRQAVRRQSRERRRDLVLRCGPRREAEAGPPVEGCEHRRGCDDDPRHQQAVEPDEGAPELYLAVLRQDRRLRLRRVAEGDQHRRLQGQEHTERGGELRERRCCLERPEREQLHRDAEDDDDGERDHERGRGRDVRPEETGAQCPVGVAGEHGDAAACEVDHARPAVEEDNGERDAGDQRTDAQAEQSELPDLLDLVHAQGRSLIRSRRARLESRARCSTSTRRGPGRPTVRVA